MVTSVLAVATEMRDGATDWTPVLAATVAGLTAIIGGVIGYLASKRQTAVEIKRIESDNERLRREIDESHFKHRQTLYHEFLDTAHQFHMSGEGFTPFDQTSLSKWAQDMEHASNAVRLFGAEDIQDAIDQLESLMNTILRAAGDERPRGADMGPYIVRAYGTRKAEWLASYQHVIAVMRDEVAPQRVLARFGRS